MFKTLYVTGYSSRVIYEVSIVVTIENVRVSFTGERETTVLELHFLYYDDYTVYIRSVRTLAFHNTRSWLDFYVTDFALKRNAR